MNKYATQADMITDKTAYYKTEKAINEYRNDVPLFENLWNNDNAKAWQKINKSAQAINHKNKYLMFVFIGIWLLSLFAIMYQMPNVQEALTAYANMSEFDKHTTGRWGRLFQIVSYFGVAEYSILAIWVMLMALISVGYGKWMMKKMKLELGENM